MEKLSQVVRDLCAQAAAKGISEKIHIDHLKQQYCRTLVSKWNYAKGEPVLSAHFNLGSFWVSKANSVDVDRLSADECRELIRLCENRLFRLNAHVGHADFRPGRNAEINPDDFPI